MVMSRIWVIFLLTSCFCALLTDSAAALSAAVTEGAGAGAALAVSLAGSLCLWSGVGHLMTCTGVTAGLARLLRPLLHRLFPEARQDPGLAGALSANFCANLLGLGNAATPMGIRAAKRLARGSGATPGLCRLVVLNTASLQLIPATVAALRSRLGCERPFDILPAVWITGVCSAAAGLGAAWVLERLWAHD